MSGPMNAVMGDQDSPLVEPQTVVDEDALIEEKKLAQYSKTAEFKRLKEFLEARVEFYKHYLPSGSLVEGDPKDGRPYTVNMQGMTPDQIAAHWMAACIVTKEFENILGEYARAREAVDAAGRQDA